MTARPPLLALCDAAATHLTVPPGSPAWLLEAHAMNVRVALRLVAREHGDLAAIRAATQLLTDADKPIPGIPTPALSPGQQRGEWQPHPEAGVPS